MYSDELRIQQAPKGSLHLHYQLLHCGHYNQYGGQPCSVRSSVTGHLAAADYQISEGWPLNCFHYRSLVSLDRANLISFRRLTNLHSVCIVSIAHIQILATLNPIDLTWTQVYPGIWACVEASIGVVVACTPSLTPIILSCIRGRRSPTETIQGSDHRRTVTFTEKGDHLNLGRLAAFNSSQDTFVARCASASDNAQAERGLELDRQASEETWRSDELPLNGIFVRNDIECTSEEKTRRAPRTPTPSRPPTIYTTSSVPLPPKAITPP
jgi:hypothetical protein